MNSVRIQWVTCFSTSRGIWSRPPTLAFSPAASISANIPTAVPPPCTQPRKPGWALRAAKGRIELMNSAWICASGVGWAGRSSRKRARTSSGIACHTGNSRMVFHVSEHVVEHLVGLLTKAGPMRWVERSACRRCSRRLVCGAAYAHFFAGLVFSQGIPHQGDLACFPLPAIGMPCCARNSGRLALGACDAKTELKGQEGLPITDVSEGM